MLASGVHVLEYNRVVQESVFEQLRVVRQGQLRIVFSTDVKVSRDASTFVKVLALQSVRGFRNSNSRVGCRRLRAVRQGQLRIVFSTDVKVGSRVGVFVVFWGILGILRIKGFYRVSKLGCH